MAGEWTRCLQLLIIIYSCMLRYDCPWIFDQATDRIENGLVDFERLRNEPLTVLICYLICIQHGVNGRRAAYARLLLQECLLIGVDECFEEAHSQLAAVGDLAWSKTVRTSSRHCHGSLHFFGREDTAAFVDAGPVRTSKKRSEDRSIDPIFEGPRPEIQFA